MSAPTLTAAEQEALLADPRALRLLMQYEQRRYDEASIVLDDDEIGSWPTPRWTMLYERGRSIIAEDLEVWDAETLLAFGFPVPAASPEAPEQAAQPAAAAQVLAWARMHPNRSFAGDLLPDHQIDDVRKRSGAWVPLVPAQPADPPPGWKLVLVPEDTGPEPDWDDVRAQAEEALGLKVEQHTYSIIIREVRRWLAARQAAQPADVARLVEVIDRRFQSSKGVPVELAVVKAAEWATLRAALAAKGDA